jgi:cold shock protein
MEIARFRHGHFAGQRPLCRWRGSNSTEPAASDPGAWPAAILLESKGRKMSSKSTGVVKHYREDKGFGFIAPDSGGGEIFFHISTCAESIDDLVPGDRVRFEQRESQRRPGKPEAFNVEMI